MTLLEAAKAVVADGCRGECWCSHEETLMNLRAAILAEESKIQKSKREELADFLENYDPLSYYQSKFLEAAAELRRNP